MNKLLILMGACCLLAASCRKNTPQANPNDLYYRGNVLHIPEQSAFYSRIKLQTVERKHFSAEFHTTGVVKAINGQMAEVAPLFDGRISRSFVSLGQRVSAGTPLFEIHSAGFSEMVKNYFQSLQTKKMKETNLQRQKDLAANGVGVARELEEAETDFELALKEYENALANLETLSINPDKLTVGQPLQILSPIGGEVVQMNPAIGQYVKSEGEQPLAIVAELSKVWVVAQVKEKHIGSIFRDDRVEIRTEANPGQLTGGYVSYIGELLDEETRSVQVFIVCDNQDRSLKPGMFAGVTFINQPKEAIVIPSTALLQNEEEAYVFVQEGKDSFVKRMVGAAMVNPDEILISGGLEAGETIIAEGGIYLMNH